MVRHGGIVPDSILPSRCLPACEAGGRIMIRILSLSACLVSLVVWGAAAQQLVPKPGFTEKRERVVCGRMGCEPRDLLPRVHDGRFRWLARCLQGCLQRPVASIVSKRLASRYRTGRSPDWLKFKNPGCTSLSGAKPKRIGAGQGDDHRKSLNFTPLAFSLG